MAVQRAKKMQFSFQRYEKKYLITPAQQEALLAAAAPYMEPDAYGRYTICNIYYDTENWSLIRQSLEKPVYKEKLRVRSYGVPGGEDPVFVEIKKKCDGIVYKRRIQMEDRRVEDFLLRGRDAPEGQIAREIQWFQRFHASVPRVFIGYDRTALAGVEDPELRMTFDTSIRWRDYDLDLCRGDYGELILPPEAVLMEVKIPGVAPLWLSRLLSELGIFPTSFSKYGTCYQQFILGKKELRYSA